MRKDDLIFIDFLVLVLTPRLNGIETSLQLSHTCIYTLQCGVHAPVPLYALAYKFDILLRLWPFGNKKELISLIRLTENFSLD
jgi:hypothetical protein